MIALRTLVTGATGFLGSHLAARLLAEGHEVHAIVRQDSKLAALNDPAGRIEVHVLDASYDNLDQIIERAGPDVVFHLATHFTADHAAQDVTPLVSCNILFPCRLVDAMVRRGCLRLVNCSSAWQHYEDAEYNPTNLYAATKQALLALLTYYVEASGLVVADLTIPDTYGPDDRRAKLFSALYRAASSAEPLAFSPGEQLLDLVYVDDVVEALLMASALVLEKQKPELTRYALRSPRPIPLREVAAIFATVTKLTPNIAWGRRPYRDREMMMPWQGGELLPGWRPAVEIEDGIRKVHASHVRPTKN